jgi:hypothetical protein
MTKIDYSPKSNSEMSASIIPELSAPRAGVAGIEKAHPLALSANRVGKINLDQPLLGF